MLLPGEDEDEMLGDDGVRRLLATVCDLSAVRVVRRRVYRFHSLLAERFQVDGRVFLVGDAAHMMPPFQGQGMNSGFRDAMNLAWKLAAVIKGTAGKLLLESYDQERRPHARAMMDLSRQVGELLMTRNPVLALVRDLTFATLARWPASSRYLAEMRFKPKPKASGGFFLPNTGSDAGALLIQPDVLLASGVRTRLDDVLGPGFALLRVAQPEALPFRAFDGNPTWSRLGARRVSVWPGGVRLGAHGADITVGDLGGQLARRLSPANGHHTVLVRPDRFIAALIRDDQADTIAAELAAQLGGASQA